MDKLKIAEAIRILTEAQDQAAAILLEAKAPEFRLSVINGIGRIVKPMAFTIGDTPVSIISDKPLTHVIGIPVSVSKQPPAAPVVYSPSEKERIKEEFKKIYESFPSRKVEDIEKELTDIEIRGVAKMAGLPVTTTEPEKITPEFILEIKAAIEKKKELDEVTQQSQEAAKKAGKRQKQ